MIELTIPRVIKGWGADKLLTPDFSNMRPNRYGRRFSCQREHPLTGAAFKEFGFTDIHPEPIFKIFTGNHYLEGAFTHTHKDPAPLGFEHVRCNVMVKKPPVGGNPVLDGEELIVEQNDLWICFASVEYHGSTPIEGGERIIISFGALIPKDDVHKVFIR